MTRAVAYLVAFLTLAIALAAPAQAQRRGQVTPYIEAAQVLTADVQSGDVLTYSSVSAGIDASVQTRRVQVQLAYRYERRFSHDSAMADDDVHSGIARVNAVVAPGFTFEAGGMAARARGDIRGDAPGSQLGNPRNLSQVYSGYAGPNVQLNAGPVFLNGVYRLGYTRVESPGSTGLPSGQPSLDVFDDSLVHVATASTGFRAGTLLPVGVTLSGSYTRENAGQLDQRYEGMFGRGDVVLPVGRGLALTAGVGHERIEISQRDPLLDVNGDPVVDGAGRQVTDPNSPRRIAYNFDGLFYDAGVIWRPSRRTTLEARAGRRYGSMSYTGSLSYQIGPGSGIQIGVYDSIDSFGRQLSGSIAALPTAFVTTNDPFGNQYSGCIYGTSGNAAGSCMTGVLGSAATANYRSRGVTGVLVMGRGRNRLGFGGGYSRRTYIAPTNVPGSGLNVNGTSDQTYFAQVFASREMSRDGSLSANAFASYFDSDLAGADGVLSWGANTIYTHQFGGLGATAALGIYGFDQQDDESAVSAQALLGLRYGF